MTHDVEMILLEVYGFNFTSTGGPSARITVHPVLTHPGVVRPSTPQKTPATSRSQSCPPPKRDQLDGWEHSSKQSELGG